MRPPHGHPRVSSVRVTSRPPDVAAAPGALQTWFARHRHAILPHVSVILGLLVLSIGMWWHVWITGDPRTTMACQCGDPALFLWFVKWVPWSIAHLHDPFFSNAIYAGQGGANTLDTAVLLQPLLLAPVTAVAGPVAAFNVIVTIAPVLNGWAMFVLLRKVTHFLPGQVLASVLYGFSPYVIGQEPFGHFNIDLVAFAPLALWCAYDLLVDGRHRPAVVGVLLGCLCAAQFLAGPELLAMSALIALIGGIALLLIAPRLVLERRRPLLVGLVTAGAVAGLLVGYPVWFLVAGPRHFAGYPWPATPAEGFLPGTIALPGTYRVASPAAAFGGYFGAEGPNSSYLGIALLALVGVSALVWRRRRLAWCLLVVGIVGWVLSFGVRPNGMPAGIWLPWRIFDHAPVVSEILPGRFGLFSDLAAAILLAISLDLWWSRRARVADLVRRRTSWRPRRVELAWGALCSFVALGALVPIAWTYPVPFAVHDNPVPAWFADVAPRLHQGTVLLVMPYAPSGEVQAMAWQADAGFSYSMVGGYALVPGPHGRSISVDPPGGAEALLSKLSFGLTPEPTGTPAETSAVRASLERWGVNVVVATTQVRDPLYDVGFLTAVMGRLPVWQDGSWVWYGLGHQPAFGVPATRLESCSSHRHEAPLAAAECVLQGPRQE